MLFFDQLQYSCLLSNCQILVIWQDQLQLSKMPVFCLINHWTMLITFCLHFFDNWLSLGKGIDLWKVQFQQSPTVFAGPSIIHGKHAMAGERKSEYVQFIGKKTCVQYVQFMCTVCADTGCTSEAVWTNGSVSGAGSASAGWYWIVNKPIYHRVKPATYAFCHELFTAFQ